MAKKIDSKINAVREDFRRLKHCIGHTSDARRALGSEWSDYVLKEMIKRGLLRKLDYDLYQLTECDEGRDRG